MNLEVFHLEATSPFRVGQRGAELTGSGTLIHSDTVFSALAVNYRMLYPNDFAAWLEQFHHSPPFLLSSALPYVALSADDSIRFFPRPKIEPPGTDSYQAFSLRKVKLVSQSVFEMWLANDNRLSAPQYLAGDAFFHQKQVWCTPEEATRIRSTLDISDDIQLWGVQDVPRVTVDRITHATNIYHAGRLHFRPGSGLWLGIQWFDAGQRSAILDTLAILGDSGLGGERSIGHGQFQRVDQTETISLPDPTERFTTLSLYWPNTPRQAQTLTDDSAYDLIIRGGWSDGVHGQAVRRKSVRMLTEGSVLQMLQEPLLGGLANVKPDNEGEHPIYRYGFALPVGFGEVIQYD